MPQPNPEQGGFNLTPDDWSDWTPSASQPSIFDALAQNDPALQESGEAWSGPVLYDQDSETDHHSSLVQKFGRAAVGFIAFIGEHGYTYPAAHRQHKQNLWDRFLTDSGLRDRKKDTGSDN